MLAAISFVILSHQVFLKSTCSPCEGESEVAGGVMPSVFLFETYVHRELGLLKGH